MLICVSSTPFLHAAIHFFFTLTFHPSFSRSGPRNPNDPNTSVLLNNIPLTLLRAQVLLIVDSKDDEDDDEGGRRNDDGLVVGYG